MEMPAGAVNHGDREARSWRDDLVQVLGVAIGYIVTRLMGL
ncbi:hypothetical protein [Streptomyces sp. NBC_00892]|nr:hypothetical protein [Streptomyces sp. NBC_00892]MCX4902332.1 hypothetical protein [Streptomyces sp. NBC_00892]